VPKTLADLHVDSGLPISDHMNGGNFSLYGKTHFTNTPLHHATTLGWSGCFCFLSLILFLSCQEGCLRTTLTNILHSPVSLILYEAPFGKIFGENYVFHFFFRTYKPYYALVKTELSPLNFSLEVFLYDISELSFFSLIFIN